MMKRVLCVLTALCCVFLLNSCTGTRIEENQTPVATLPPAEARFTAPDGDANNTKVRDYNLYFPGRDGLSLVSKSVTLKTENPNDTVEKLMKELLAFEGDVDAKKLGEERPLELSGAHPIEISGNVCTVNLSRSALDSNKKDYYKDCLAIATTLCELNEINGVNVLVDNKSVPLDITGHLPMGTLMGHAGESIQSLWEQTDAKKTPLAGGDQSKNPLNALTTIYYPLADSRGVACSMRRVNFTGQKPEQLAVGLIDEISNTRRTLAGGQNFPELKSLLLHEPVLTIQEGGERILTLSLKEDAAEILKEARTDDACFTAAVTLTLTTFIPDIYAVRIRIGDQLVTELKTARFERATALSGLVERRSVQQYLMSSVTVYFARNGILCECERPVASGSVNSLRTQLCALMEGPDPTEEEGGIVPTLPEAVREDDILGISAEGDTLLVNLSEHFRAEIAAQDPEDETMICYSMVNTLCKNTGMKRVRFFFEGEQQEYLAGTIYWAGEFLYNIGLAEKGLG